VVDYQGPAFLRRVTESLKIPFFNRVSEIRYAVRDMSEIQLEQDEVARLRRLEKISVSRYGAKPFDADDINAAESIVPPCRLGNVETAKNRIEIDVVAASRLACCAP